MESPRTTSHGKTIFNIFLKKTFQLLKLIVFILTVIQFYNFYFFIPNIAILLEDSKYENNNYISKISIRNGSQAVDSNDIFSPISIELSNEVLAVQVNNGPLNYAINSNTLNISFDLLNMNESSSLFIITKNRPIITKIEGRIKGISEFNLYDYKYKPEPIKRIINFWWIFLISSIILFFQALFLLIKDREFQQLKFFVTGFHLTKNNQDEFIEKYGDYYSKWQNRLKPDVDFMKQIIKNLFAVYPCENDDDISLIKNWTNIKTELYSFYRLRAVFSIVGIELFLISFIALLFNYVFFEFNGLSYLISIDLINKIAYIVVMILLGIAILFPRHTFNYLAFKKKK